MNLNKIKIILIRKLNMMLESIPSKCYTYHLGFASEPNPFGYDFVIDIGGKCRYW